MGDIDAFVRTAIPIAALTPLRQAPFAPFVTNKITTAASPMMMLLRSLSCLWLWLYIKAVARYACCVHRYMRCQKLCAYNGRDLQSELSSCTSLLADAVTGNADMFRRQYSLDCVCRKIVRNSSRCLKFRHVKAWFPMHVSG